VNILGSLERGSPIIKLSLTSFLGRSLSPNHHLQGYGQQDVDGKATNQQEHVGRCGLKLGQRTGEVLDGEEE
jgi:hypothetical protein